MYLLFLDQFGPHMAKDPRSFISKVNYVYLMRKVEAVHQKEITKIFYQMFQASAISAFGSTCKGEFLVHECLRMDKEMFGEHFGTLIIGRGRLPCELAGLSNLLWLGKCMMRWESFCILIRWFRK